MELSAIVRELDAAFRVDLVRSDDWTTAFDHAFAGDGRWRDVLEPAFAGRFAGLAVRGGDEVERAVACVFPHDELIDGLEPGTLLFSEHPLGHTDRGGFEAVAFDRLRDRGCSLYVVHAPLYQHPELGPSRLLAEGIGLHDVEVLHPLEPQLPGGILAVGESDATVDGLAERIRSFLGPRIPVHVLTRTSDRVGSVAVVAGGGARVDLLRAALEQGCRTYVTGNAATNSEVARVQARVRAFRELADAEHVSLVDATHYGSERPSHLAMVAWLDRRGLPAAFAETGPR